MKILLLYTVYAQQIQQQHNNKEDKQFTTTKTKTMLCKLFKWEIATNK